jgi:hypothetical protein
MVKIQIRQLEGLSLHAPATTPKMIKQYRGSDFRIWSLNVNNSCESICGNMTHLT